MKRIGKYPYLVAFKEVQNFLLIIVKLNLRNGFEICRNLSSEILFKDHSSEGLRYEYPVYGKEKFIHFYVYEKATLPEAPARKS